VVVTKPGSGHVRRRHERVGLLQIRQRALPAATAGQQVRRVPVDSLEDGGAQQNRRTCSLCRSSTSASRYSTTVRSVPENSAANRSGSGCPASDSAASRSPAAQPSARSGSTATARPVSSTPAAANRSPASAALNRKSPARISAVPHDQRLQLPQRLAGVEFVHVVDHQLQPLLQWRQALEQPLYQRPPVQVRRRRHRPHQFRPRAGRPQGADHRQPEPLRNLLIPPGRHPRGRPARSAPAIPDRSSTVFPLPAAPGTTCTRAGPPSRSNSAGRDTTPPAPWRASRPLADSDAAAGSTVTIIARHP